MNQSSAWVIALVTLLTISSASLAAAEDLSSPCHRSVAGGLILDRKAYEFPFETYQQWLSFMDRAPDPAWHSSQMRSLLSEETFVAYRDGESVTAERFVYQSDGLRINGVLVMPRGPAQCHPVIVYSQGGVAQWSRLTFFDVLEMHRLAAQGYIVAASLRRGEGGSEGLANMGPGDLSDMLNLVKVIDSMPQANRNKFAYLGFSRGGALGYRVLANSRRFSAAVIIGAPTDLLTAKRRDEFDEHVYPTTVTNYANDKDAALRQLSAFYWPEKIHSQTALLLLHGNADERVEASESLALAAKLSDLGRTLSLKLYDGGSHTLIEHQQDVRDQIDTWLGRYYD